ncbi:MAG: flagellar hook-associated protein FlgK [Oscillospiraceae bacterium]|jgi:flagellar hook-associated protein 1 FlgK|nr:flagellar hook-associated protein FlgK [Oscillospiraceae bacterium]
MSVRPTFFGLEIAKTGLFVSQKGLDVTGHNVANADTEGYTRQRLVNTAYEPYSVPTLLRPVDQALVGGGAHVMILDQIRDQFLDRQFRTENSTLAYWNARSQALTYVQGLFEGAETSNLTESINAFFAALNVSTEDAASGAFRTTLREAATTMVTDFNLMYERLEQQQLGLDKTVEVLTENINDIARQIQDLNKTIYSYELGNQPANDLRDKRNLLVDKLSEIVDIDYGEIGPAGQAFGGKFWLTIGGEYLVNHTDVYTLKCSEKPNVVDNELMYNSSAISVVKVPQWSDTSLNLNISDGRLLATMEMRDNMTYNSATGEKPGVPYFMEQLSNLARAIAQEINAVHKTGYTSENAPSGSVTGIDFFNIPSGVIADLTAGNFRLDDDILASIYNIAASELPIVTDPTASAYNPGGDLNSTPIGTTHEGNQVNMIKMYDAIMKKDIVVNGVTIGWLAGFLDGLVVDVAATLGTSKGFESARAIQTLAVANQRESISGVNLDEEMTNLIKYQHAYGSASRVITAMDEALDTLINKMGVVGR